MRAVVLMALLSLPLGVSITFRQSPTARYAKAPWHYSTYDSSPLLGPTDFNSEISLTSGLTYTAQKAGYFRTPEAGRKVFSLIDEHWVRRRMEAFQPWYSIGMVSGTLDLPPSEQSMFQIDSLASYGCLPTQTVDLLQGYSCSFGYLWRQIIPAIRSPRLHRLADPLRLHLSNLEIKSEISLGCVAYLSNESFEATPCFNERSLRVEDAFSFGQVSAPEVPEPSTTSLVAWGTIFVLLNRFARWQVVLRRARPLQRTSTAVGQFLLAALNLQLHHAFSLPTSRISVHGECLLHPSKPGRSVGAYAGPVKN